MAVRYLYVSDLDGTLLQSDGELSARTRAGLVRLLEQGVAVTVASARSFFSIKSLLGDMPFALPIIGFNGALLTDYHSGEHLHIHALPEEVSQLVLDLIHKTGHRPFISSHDGVCDRLHYDELINDAMRWYEERRRAACDPRLTRTGDLRRVLRENVVSMTVMTESQAAALELHAELNLLFGAQLALYPYENAYSPGSWWLTIHDPRANKSLAVDVLRQKLTPDWRVVAFGDHLNDLPMVERADLGIAVQNAVDAVKRVADQVIGHCDDDSVIKFVERHVQEAAT